jgi:hypothetical protein
MNERTRELADKIWAEEYWTDPNTDKLLPAQLNRFAELIVNECAKLVEDNMDPQNAWITPAFIKEHFGVEE